MSHTPCWARRVRRLAAALAGLLASQAGWSQGVNCLPPPAGDGPFHGQPQLPQSEAVIVFIHGLHGDARATWTTGAGPSAVAWPCLVMSDSEAFGSVNTYMASYRSKPGTPNPDTRKAAALVLADMRTAGVFTKHSHVVFVAHSMGGIVLARLLTEPGMLDAQERTRVRLVILAGTPAEPTEAAAICAKFGVNEQCAEMSDAAEMRRLWSAWDQMPSRPPTWCVAEGSDMWWLGLPPWKRIVPVGSAHRPCARTEQRAVADGMDHSDVAKPPAVNERPHRDLRNAFAACVRPRLSMGDVPETAAERTLAEAANLWFYRLVDALVPDADWQDVLSKALAPASEVGRFWNPPSQAPSFEFEQYEPQSAQVFVQTLRQALPDLLPRLVFQKARPVAKVGAISPDSKLRVLTQRMQSAAGLRATDWLVALKPTAELDGQLLLLLRPASGGGFGLLGVLFIPKVTERCLAA